MSDFTTEAFTLLAVGLVIIGARTYARCSQVGVRGLEPDDYLMVLAAVSRCQLHYLEGQVLFNVHGH